MLTVKCYKQKWLHLKYSLRKETDQGVKYKNVWEFQKSILSLAEQRLCDIFSLHLPESDPRHWVIQESDRVYKELRDR